MTCEFTRDESGKVVMIICGSPWGIGISRIDPPDPEIGDSVYGFPHVTNPHDFFPDPESCSPEEIAAHKQACEAWDAAVRERG